MIDANRQRFWMLSRREHFDPTDPSVTWDEDRRVLRLASGREVAGLPGDRGRARELADESIPVTFDAHDTWASTSEDRDSVLAGGVFDDPQEIHSLEEGESIPDMAMGRDGVLYVLVDDGEAVSVHLLNRRGSKEEGKERYEGYDGSRYDSGTLEVIPVPDGRPDRVVALASGGALLLDRDGRRLWEVRGEPHRDRPRALYAPHTPRPIEDGPPPQELVERDDLPLPEGRVVAMASNPEGVVAVLLHGVGDAGPAVVVLIRGFEVGAPVALAGAEAPFSIGWLGGSTWAVMFADREETSEQEAIGYPIPFSDAAPEAPVLPLGRRYPLNRGAEGRYRNRGFCNGLSRPARYPSTAADGGLVMRPLNPLSLPGYPTGGVSSGPYDSRVDRALPFDSGEHGATWHRLYLEAHVPAGTGVKVRLRASDDPDDEDAPWVEHHFGTVPAEPGAARGTWLPEASEVPYHPGLLYCAPRRDTAGLFVALVQRPGRASRSLVGRYLRVGVELVGNGHVTPEVAAVRVYGPRTSYAREYLPELYLEAPRGDEPGNASGADFLERFLCLFEGVLTPLEDKIASAYLLTNPRSAPADALDWLARWVSLGLEADFSEEQKRELIRNATTLYRWRGTMSGLLLALNLATDRWVDSGAIVVLEDFRLRRTFASILGADLSVEYDPLLAGPIPSANSFVGDTLILGEEAREELFVLFSGDVIQAEGQEAAVQSFVEALADRVTVLVHEHTSADDLSLIRRVVSLELPAHLDFRIVSASEPLLVGLYSLVGVDTFLQIELPRRYARVGRSFVGRRDFVRKLPVLDDRMLP